MSALGEALKAMAKTLGSDAVSLWSDGVSIEVRTDLGIGGSGPDEAFLVRCMNCYLPQRLNVPPDITVDELDSLRSELRSVRGQLLAVREKLQDARRQLAVTGMEVIE